MQASCYITWDNPALRFENPADRMSVALEEKKPAHFAIKQQIKLKLSIHIDIEVSLRFTIKVSQQKLMMIAEGLLNLRLILKRQMRMLCHNQHRYVSHHSIC